MLHHQKAEVVKNSVKTFRRHDLDWLRVLAFMLLIFYHAGMIFASWGWHIQHSQPNRYFEWGMLLVNQWRMPLIFFIGGAVIWYSLKKRNNKQFIKERVIRILLPLAFGMLAVVVPQAYFEQVHQNGYSGSFWQFYAQEYFPNHLTWNHLWYLTYVFIYSVICLPLFNRSLKGGRVEWFTQLLNKQHGVLLLALPIMLSEVLLRRHFPSYQNFVTDLANDVYYLLIFVYGFLLATNERVTRIINENRWKYFLLGTALYALLYGLFWITPGVNADEDYGVTGYIFYQSLQSFNTWVWLLVIYGFANRHLSFSNSFLRYASNAVYPFYILHQTVIIIIGFFIINWPLNQLNQFLLISMGTYLICWLLYEIIRRFRLLSLLFGLKLKAPQRKAELVNPPAIPVRQVTKISSI